MNKEKEKVFTKWDFIKTVILLVGVSTAIWFMIMVVLSMGNP